MFLQWVLVANGLDKVGHPLGSLPRYFDRQTRDHALLPLHVGLEIRHPGNGCLKVGDQAIVYVDALYLQLV
jgi:hypothetical protein